MIMPHGPVRFFQIKGHVTPVHRRTGGHPRAQFAAQPGNSVRIAGEIDSGLEITLRAVGAKFADARTAEQAEADTADFLGRLHAHYGYAHPQRMKGSGAAVVRKRIERNVDARHQRQEFLERPVSLDVQSRGIDAMLPEAGLYSRAHFRRIAASGDHQQSAACATRKNARPQGHCIVGNL